MYAVKSVLCHLFDFALCKAGLPCRMLNDFKDGSKNKRERRCVMAISVFQNTRDKNGLSRDKCETPSCVWQLQLALGVRGETINHSAWALRIVCNVSPTSGQVSVPNGQLRNLFMQSRHWGDTECTGIMLALLLQRSSPARDFYFLDSEVSE